MHMCDKIVEFCFAKEGKLYQKVYFVYIYIYFRSIFLSNSYLELNLYIFSFKMI